MYQFAKKIFKHLPEKTQYLILYCYEEYFRYTSGKRITYTSLNKNTKKNILFYHISGLSFGGTEKFLQIIAKWINKEKYNVFFMYSPQSKDLRKDNNDGRKEYLNGYGINIIPFIHKGASSKYPYTVIEMKPNLEEVLKENKIDLLFTAGSGYSEHPFNLLTKLPTILINIFGSPTTQKNIKKHICISKEVSQKIENIVPKKDIEINYIPSERPTQESLHDGKLLRESFGIKPIDMVFGRIGRADNGIFDPIGINAFKIIQKEYPEAHYIIMSPPPILEEIVAREKIQNVHFIAPSSKEKDIWAFHNSLDVMAHFRNDGESCGLNIIESLLCGKPVITHKSHIWNAHLEYLNESFSRVSEKDDVETYARYMKEMILLKKEGGLSTMGEVARKEAEKLFLIENNITTIEKWTDSALQ